LGNICKQHLIQTQLIRKELAVLPVTVIEDMKDLEPEVMKHIKQTDVVIDIGCGIRPQKLIKPKVHIGIEPYAEYIQHLEKKLVNHEC
jgi:hypothetical protein